VNIISAHSCRARKGSDIFSRFDSISRVKARQRTNYTKKKWVFRKIQTPKSSYANNIAKENKDEKQAKNKE
jgi:hypothetical protein